MVNEFDNIILTHILKYEIMIDKQLKSILVPSRNFLSTTLVHEKVQLIPFLKGALMIKR